MSWVALDYATWTDADLQACVEWWAQKLGLGGWKFKATFKPYRDMGGCWATALSHENYEEAEIDVVRWVDREGARRDREKDIEVSVVHEMVHVRFWSADSCFYEAGEVAKATYEASIERTAQALVELRRACAKNLP